MRTRVLVAVAVSAALFTFRPSVARAQDGNPAVAEALFREGQRLMKENSVAEACGKFAESMRLDPTTGTLLNLALCHEKEGKLALAWTEMSQAASQSARAGNKDREKFARDEVAALEKRLAHARITIAKDAGVTDLSVDGQPLGTAAWSIPLPLDPGEHVFEFSGGERHKTMKVTFAEGASKEVALTSLGDPGGSPIVHDGVVPPPSTTPPSGDSSTRRTIGFVVGGVGVAGVVVGTVFGLKALGNKSDTDDNCIDSRCNPAGLAAADDARSAATLSTVGFGVGIAGLAVGTFLVLTSPHAKTSSAKLRVAPVLAGSSRGFALSGAF
jgi:hypothetical protein